LHQVEAVLPDNPEIGRNGRVAGTRELVIPKTPFLVPYRVNGQSLEILRIYHAAQRWPEVFRNDRMASLENPGTDKTTLVAMHPGELPCWLFKKIIKDSGLIEDEFRHSL
jgi:hypothetical protein